MATDTMNCSSQGVDACGALVKASSGAVATGMPYLLQGVLFCVAALIFVIIIKSQYQTWSNDSDYTMGDLLWNGSRAVGITLIVLIFIAL